MESTIAALTIPVSMMIGYLGAMKIDNFYEKHSKKKQIKQSKKDFEKSVRNYREMTGEGQ
jgi:type III secretory pathway component EscU